MGLGKGCLCQPEWGAGVEEAAGPWGRNSVLERQPHSPMLHSPHSAGEAHKTLAVSQGLGEGSGKKQGRKQNPPPKLPRADSLRLHPQTPATRLPGPRCTEGPF